MKITIRRTQENQEAAGQLFSLQISKIRRPTRRAGRLPEREPGRPMEQYDPGME
jgi:hypothetical protein